MTPTEIESLASKLAAAFILAVKLAESGNGNGHTLDNSAGPVPIAQVTIAETESVILLLEPDASHPQATPRTFTGEAIQVYWHRKDRWTKALMPRAGLEDAPLQVLTQLLPHLDTVLETLALKRPETTTGPIAPKAEGP